MHPLEINPAGGEPAAVENGDQITVLTVMLSSHHSHLKRPVAPPMQQTIGDAASGQNRFHNNLAGAWRNHDSRGKLAIQFIAQHLHGSGIAWAGVPRTFAEGFHTHQIVREVRGLKTVFHRTPIKRQRDRLTPRIDDNQAKGEQSTRASAPELGLVGGVYL